MPLQIEYPPFSLPADMADTDACVAFASQFLHAQNRPRDFSARIRRRDMASLRRTLRRTSLLRQRLTGIAAFGALGMLLGPLGWGQPGGIEPASAHERGELAQPVEQTGDSFPGSALYWLTPDGTGLITPAQADAAWNALRDVDDDTGTSTLGPAARAVMATGSSEDRWRAQQCLTAAIYYEAASEPDAGQRAVAQVVLNRVAHPAYPNTVCGVVYQGSERPGCQFSFACDGSLARRPVRAFWDRARRVAGDALAGYVYAPVGLATHYHTSAVHPYWADSLNFIGVIGAHRFYRWNGAAGKPAAFTARYVGGEPVAAPHPRTWTPAPADMADPLSLARAFEEGRTAAMAQQIPAAASTSASFGQTPLSHAPLPGQPAPARETDSNDNAQPLSRSGQIRPEYENAGRWIAQPKS